MLKNLARTSPAPLSRSLRLSVLLTLVCAALLGYTAAIRADAAPAPDTLVFTNGDTLKGKLVTATGSGITFHSDMAGDLTISWDKIKTLDSANSFALIKNGQKVSRKTPAAEVPQGTLAVSDKNVNITTPTGTATVSTSNTEAIVNAADFHKIVYLEPGQLHGFTGALTLGAALVESTQKTNTYNGALNLVRTVPDAAWIAPRNRTTLNITAIYGLQKQEATLTTLPSSVKTDIIHGDLERDEYLSPKFYYLGYASADHNYSQGLALQDTFGAGFGYTVLKTPKQELDAKTDVHYEQQQFVAGSGAQDLNLIGIDLAESYTRKLPKGLGLAESGVYTPSFVEGSPYSAAVTALFTFPVYKKISFNAGIVDDYISNPAPSFNANSFQFTAGLTYAFK